MASPMLYPTLYAPSLPPERNQRATTEVIARQCLTLVGATGFEPATSCSRSRRSTGLSYAPNPATIPVETASGCARRDSNSQPSDP